MKTLVVFYSYSGHTRVLAEQLAVQESAEIAEIKAISHPGKIRAYTFGCFAAIRGKAWPIHPLGVDMGAYNRLVLVTPVWAGNPPPPMFAVLDQLPQGKPIAIKMVSASGKSTCKDRLKAAIQAKACTLESFEDIKV